MLVVLLLVIVARRRRQIGQSVLLLQLLLLLLLLLLLECRVDVLLLAGRLLGRAVGQRQDHCHQAHATQQ